MTLHLTCAFQVIREQSLRMSKDVQYKHQDVLWESNQAHLQHKQVDHQVLVQGSTTQKVLPNVAYGRLQKSIIYEISKKIFSF